MRIILLLFFFLLSVQFSSQMLTSVYFEHNSFALSKETRRKLDSLSKLDAKLTFRIFGNANIIGTEDFNLLLSENRAKKVSIYLKARIGQNIKLGSARGLGESKQINDNSTQVELAQNRRVDIFIEKTLQRGEAISRKTLPSFFKVKEEAMKVRDTFSIPDLNFFGGRHVWYSTSGSVLDALVKKMKNNPTMEIELQGHICCEYEDFDGLDLDLRTYNLSWTRANAIKEYLVQNGIEAKRIKAVGLGHLNPIVFPEKTDYDRTQNRRVEIVVLKK